MLHYMQIIEIQHKKKNKELSKYRTSIIKAAEAEADNTSRGNKDS